VSLDLLARYRLMVRMREFELACLEGVPTLEIHGELHTGIGQEAIGAGMAGALRDEDAVVSTHRNHLHALAKGVSPRELMAEIFERETGLCRGRGGHMHPFDLEHNFSASGIVGASLPVALGYSYAFATEGGNRVAVGITGDGGTNHGTFHETLNMAAAWELPLIVLVENNFLAISVPTSEVLATATIAERAAAYGAPGETVDGTDVEVMAGAFARAVEHARSDNGPYVLEAICQRFQGHYEGDQEQYRSKGERERIRREHDPLQIARRRLVERSLADEQAIEAGDEQTRTEMRELLAAVRSDPLPDPRGALEYVFAEGAGAEV
jgi:acetoin:2,6-dichlorophenolindophenol oxidoreductase subunit alpha